ncbi:hypothetical protein, partial [Elstera cyanobacteriorum]
MSNQSPNSKSVDYGKFVTAAMAAWIYRGDGNGTKNENVPVGFKVLDRSSNHPELTKRGLDAAFVSHINPLTGKTDIIVTYAGTAFEKAAAPSGSDDNIAALKDGVANNQGLTGTRIAQTDDAKIFINKYLADALSTENINKDNIGQIYVTGHSLGTTDALAGTAAFKQFFSDRENINSFGSEHKINFQAFSIPVYFADQVIYHKDDLAGVKVNITVNRDDPAHAGMPADALTRAFDGTGIGSFDYDDTIMGQAPAVPSLIALAREIFPAAAFMAQKENHDSGGLLKELEGRFYTTDEGRDYLRAISSEDYRAKINEMKQPGQEEWGAWKEKILTPYTPEDASILNMLTTLKSSGQTPEGRVLVALASGLGWDPLNLGQRVALQTAGAPGFPATGMWYTLDSNGIPLSSPDSNGISYAQYIMERLQNGQGLPNNIISPDDGVSLIDTTKTSNFEEIHPDNTNDSSSESDGNSGNSGFTVTLNGGGNFGGTGSGTSITTNDGFTINLGWGSGSGTSVVITDQVVSGTDQTADTSKPKGPTLGGGVGAAISALGSALNLHDPILNRIVNSGFDLLGDFVTSQIDGTSLGVSTEQVVGNFFAGLISSAVMNALGIKGIPSQIISTVLNSFVSKVVEQVLLDKAVDVAIDTAFSATFGEAGITNIAGSIGSIIGSFLANKILPINSPVGSVVSAAASYFISGALTAALGPLAFLVGGWTPRKTPRVGVGDVI